LTQVLPGVYTTVSPVFGANETKFAGVSARDVNVQRDGVSVGGERWPTGINTATELHPDLVGEIKMILAPVDAEMGRGSGQVQIQTRSGTNQFHGGGVWSAKNSVLDSNVGKTTEVWIPLLESPWRGPGETLSRLPGTLAGRLCATRHTSLFSTTRSGSERARLSMLSFLHHAHSAASSGITTIGRTAIP